MFLFAVGVVWAGALFGVGAHIIVRDPASVYNFPVYAGIISYLGVALMVATAAIAAFSSRVVVTEVLLLVMVALFSALLAIDDLVLLHEAILPAVFGMNEKVTFAVYGLIFLWLSWKVWNLRTKYDVTGYHIGLVLLGASVVVDVIEPQGILKYWFEDSLKLAGFGAWLTFWAQFCQALIAHARPLAK